MPNEKNPGKLREISGSFDVDLFQVFASIWKLIHSKRGFRGICVRYAKNQARRTFLGFLKARP